MRKKIKNRKRRRKIKRRRRKRRRRKKRKMMMTERRVVMMRRRKKTRKIRRKRSIRMKMGPIMRRNLKKKRAAITGPKIMRAEMRAKLTIVDPGGMISIRKVQLSYIIREPMMIFEIYPLGVSWTEHGC
jgi:hypothetical protein